MRSFVTIVAVVALTGAASGSMLQDTTGVLLQQDGHTEGDAADTCAAAGPVVAPEGSFGGLLVPIDDEADFYLLSVPPSSIGTRITVTLSRASVEVGSLHEVYDADCSTIQYAKPNGKGKIPHCVGEGHEDEQGENREGGKRGEGHEDTSTCLTENAVRDGDSITLTLADATYVLAVVYTGTVTVTVAGQEVVVPLTCHNLCLPLAEGTGGYGIGFG